MSAETSTDGLFDGGQDDTLEPFTEVTCLCGEVLHVPRGGGDRVWLCHGCEAEFSLVAYRGPGGHIVHVPLFVGSSESEEPLLPEPPEDMMLTCECGDSLRITRSLYRHRVRCPRCGTRMAPVLVYDPSTRHYGIEGRKIVGPSLGDTQIVMVGSA